MSRFLGNIGRLDRVISVEESTPSYSGPQKTDAWAPITDGANIWASVRIMAGRETVEGLARQAEVTVIFRIRYLAGVKRAQRVLYAGDAYNIEHVEELGRREGLDIYARGKPE